MEASVVASGLCVGVGVGSCVPCGAGVGSSGVSARAGEIERTK